ncbi:MAG: uroporphyrinogen-III C-methyltransferase [Bacteroidales bacterium]|nr:uroporphyrinogen-III C-methyltransferase [Bacteroidales bacterium]
MEQVVPNHSELIWSYHKNQRQLETEQLMELLIKGVDLVLIPLNALRYPQTDNLRAIGVLENGSDKYNPLLLLALNDLVSKSFKPFENDLRERYGSVDIAGFGPGNPDLLTIKTQRLISEADIIFYDDLLDDQYLKQYKAELIYVGKRKGKHSTRQEDINRLLFASALQGHKVLRLKGGDPLVFGRGAEEFQYLKNRYVNVTIVPGVTSALAAAAETAIPLTSRGTSTSVAFTLGHDAIYNKLPEADTLVFYMGAAQQRNWARRLINEGWPADTPVACVRNASMLNAETKRYTIGELLTCDMLLPAPSLLIVGQTVSGSAKNHKKWLYTGTDKNYFKEEGSIVHNPMVKVVGSELNERQVELFNNLKAFDRIVFATPVAVNHFFRSLFSLNLDVRVLNGIELTSIGESTSKALSGYGLRIKPESVDSSAKGLIRSLGDKKVVNQTILLPCSEDGLSVLPGGLKDLGNEVHELHLYKNVIPENVVHHNLGDFYGVVFTSPKAVQHFFKLHNNILPSELKIRVRGSYTKKVLDKYMLRLQLKNASTLYSSHLEFDA